jgi:hypothetical protein
VLPLSRMPGVFLAVTIDFECDKGAGWRAQRPLAFEGVREGIGRRLAALFRANGAKPTYLVSPEVLRDPESVEILEAQARGGAELGTHLHGEYAEPGAFEPDVTTAFQRDYTPEVEGHKLASLTEAFRGAFGGRPRSFRAGRFGVGPASLGFLESMGYVADSSVTPFVSWEGAGAQGLSYVGAPTQPYRPSRSSPGEPGESSILEVPVTIRPSRFAGVPLLGRASGPRWLRPSRMSGAAMIEVAREAIDAARHDAPRAPVVLNSMFHNVEVIPRASPYAATERAARMILGRVAELLAFARRESIAVIGLTDVAELFA